MARENLMGEGELMQFPTIRIVPALAVLFLSWNVWAQNKTEREIQIHKNVKLIEMKVASDLPEAVVEEYTKFLPLLEEVLKENTSDQSDECSLIVRVTAGVKEIGSAKVQRPTAHFTAFRRNSRQEYVGTLILYSYINAGSLNKEEVEQFLTKQILEPAVCRQDE
jgi:chorismate mutase